MDEPDETEPRRIPGLFRRWELAEVLRTGRAYRLEAAGFLCCGTPVFVVYDCASEPVEDVE